MLNWIKNLIGNSDSNAPAARIYNFSPAGKHSYTHAGEKIIVRPSDTAEPLADAFEARLLKWLQYTLGVKPESHFGTNTLFWKFDYKGNDVELAVVGKRKNTGVRLSDELDWLLRVEESAPLQFITLLETHFLNVKRVKRNLKDKGKTRVHFKSTELLNESNLNAKKVA